jgi:hypothetical protein
MDHAKQLRLLFFYLPVLLLNALVIFLFLLQDILFLPVAPWARYTLSGLFLWFLCAVVLHGLKTLTVTEPSVDLLLRFVAAYVTAFVLVQYLFINFYTSLGLHNSEGITHDKWDALYFSIITWTTTGYGDLVPFGASRWIACSEALLGTLYNGLGLAVVIYQLNLMARPLRKE